MTPESESACERGPALGDSETLREYVCDLMHERGTAAGDIDHRRDDLPYHPLLARYGVANGSERMMLRSVCGALLPGALSAWEITPLHYLLTLVEQGSMVTCIQTLVDVVDGGSLLTLVDGTQRHMLALRTLLGLGWSRDLLFWRKQPEAIWLQYPALILRGLAKAPQPDFINATPADHATCSACGVCTYCDSHTYCDEHDGLDSWEVKFAHDGIPPEHFREV